MGFDSVRVRSHTAQSPPLPAPIRDEYDDDVADAGGSALDHAALMAEPPLFQPPAAAAAAARIPRAPRAPRGSDGQTCPVGISKPPDVGCEHPQCMPCYGTRLVVSPMVGMVFGLVALTYLPYCVWNKRTDATARLCQAVLHLLLFMMLWAYLQCVFTDAGSVPVWWTQQAHHAPHGAFAVCRRSKAPKPPRSHYDSATERLVLNMDHFCPWVANTVGFYNRKYFVLFIFYTTLACSWAALTSTLVFPEQVFPQPGCVRRRDCASSSIMLVALIIDGLFGLLLMCFTGFHFNMALNNETTIDSEAYVDTKKRREKIPTHVHTQSSTFHNPHSGAFNVGRRRNWEQVFGTNPWLWFVPVFGSGPAGNGLVWPTVHSDDGDDYDSDDDLSEGLC